MMDHPSKPEDVMDASTYQHLQCDPHFPTLTAPHFDDHTYVNGREPLNDVTTRLVPMLRFGVTVSEETEERQSDLCM